MAVEARTRIVRPPQIRGQLAVGGQTFAKLVGRDRTT